MPATDWRGTYRENGRINFPDASGRYEIYFIRERASREVVYVGMSRWNLKKACFRHFQNWVDRKQKRVVFYDRTAYEVKMLYIEDKRWVEYLEYRLLVHMRPRLNVDFEPVSRPDGVPVDYVGEEVQELPF